MDQQGARLQVERSEVALSTCDLIKRQQVSRNNIWKSNIFEKVLWGEKKNPPNICKQNLEKLTANTKKDKKYKHKQRGHQDEDGYRRREDA